MKSELQEFSRCRMGGPAFRSEALHGVQCQASVRQLLKIAPLLEPGEFNPYSTPWPMERGYGSMQRRRAERNPTAPSLTPIRRNADAVDSIAREFCGLARMNTGGG